MPKSPNSHTLVAFDQELSHLDRLLVRQFELVRGMIRDAMTAVAQCDVSLARQIILRDNEVDDLEFAIENHCIKILALRSPIANDLRWVLATLKASSELERMGDFSKNIGKRIDVLSLDPNIKVNQNLQMMGVVILDQLEKLLQAWIDEKAEPTMAVWKGDEAVDALYDSTFRELLTQMTEFPLTINSNIHLLFIAKNMERLGDHITNIAEDLYYRITGQKPAADRPKADQTCSAASYTDPALMALKKEGAE
ncbi:MAG: phosphate signaling complex protein PhoU [Magnetococcales bacterium]|nr:phosphate signaling complex protein PhoU [Magnetococcales bacterium]